MGPPGLVPPVFLGEGEGLADEARNALAQGFVPALHVPGLPGLLVDTAVSLLREHRHVGLPEVAKAVALAISPRHPLPSARQASPPQPPPKAATWWVLRHIAVQGPRLSLCRHTNDQASSSSITSKDSHFNSSYLQYFRLSSAFNLRSVTNRLPPNQTSRTWVPLPDIRRASSP